MKAVAYQLGEDAALRSIDATWDSKAINCREEPAAQPRHIPGWVKGIALLATFIIFTASRGADAQPAEPFYKGKTITIVIGSPPGGGYDFYGRLIARHLGRNLMGNPTIVVQNMPGA